MAEKAKSRQSENVVEYIITYLTASNKFRRFRVRKKLYS